MSELDGNAAGGVLWEVFGADMTAAATECAGCGATGQVGELVAYLGGPGTVMRCRSCDTLLIAVVVVHGRACVDLRGLASLDPAQ